MFWSRHRYTAWSASVMGSRFISRVCVVCGKVQRRKIKKR